MGGLRDDGAQVLDAVSTVELDLEGQLARLIDPKLAFARAKKNDGNSQEELQDLQDLLKCHVFKGVCSTKKARKTRNLEKNAKKKL